MKKETMVQGLAVLSEAFNKEFNIAVYWELLKDLEDEPFLLSIIEICKTVCQAYPNTNLAAIIRERAQEIKKRLLTQKPDDSRMIDFDPAPPPEEWIALKNKLGLK